MKILIALPALNEERSIGAVLERLPKSLPGADRVSRLVVDDGSTDATAGIAAEHEAKVLQHAHPLGVGRAFQTAVKHALHQGVDILVTLDADGQFEPEEIPEVITPIVRGEADFVTGTRFSAGRCPAGMPRAKYWGNRLVTYLLRRFTRRDLSDVSCGFRAYSRDALCHLNLFGRFTYTQETILDLSFKDLRLAEVPVSVRYFEDRESRVARSLVRYAINALKIILRTARDHRPMRFFGSLGAAVFVLGVGLDIYMLGYFVYTGQLSPYKFVAFTGVTLNIAGILVFGLALLADMLDRMRINQERILYYERCRLYGLRHEPGSEDFADVHERRGA